MNYKILRLKAFASLALIVAFTATPLPAQDIVQERGVDSRVNYKELVKFGPWDDRNYELTLEDLKVLSPEEETLRVHIPAFFRVFLRKTLPMLPRTGTPQYHRSAPEVFRLLYGGILRDGKIINHKEHDDEGEFGMKAVPVNGEVKINTVTGSAESAIAINPVNGDLVIAGANGGSGGQEMFYSSDGGQSWQSAGILDGSCCDPTVAWSSDGAVAYTATLGNCSGACDVWVYRSIDNGATWLGPVVVAANFSDKEYLHVDDSPTSPFKDNVYITWHEGNVMHFARSLDKVLTFENELRFNAAPTGIGSDITTDSAGNVYYIWPATRTNPPAIYLKKSTDGGASFADEVQIAPTNADFIYPLPSTTIRQAFVYVAAAADRSGGPFNGSIYACWNDTVTTDNESVASANHSRIVFAYSRDGGQTWNTTVAHPTADQETVDRFHPWMDVDAGGIIHVVYYDTTRDATRVKTDLYYTSSTDGGQTFATPERITGEQSAKILDTFEYGDYNGMSLDLSKVLPIWTDNRAEAGDAQPDVDVYTALVENTFSTPGFSLSFGQNPVRSCAPGMVAATLNVGSIAGYTGTVNLSAGTLPTGVSIGISPSTATVGSSVTVTVTLTENALGDSLNIPINGTAAGAEDRTVGLVVNVAREPADPPLLTAPVDGADFVGTNIALLNWAEVADVGTFQVQVSTTDTFVETVFDQEVSAQQVTVDGLQNDIDYFWRVASVNACGVGDFSVTWTFRTGIEDVFLVDQDNNAPDVRLFFTDTLDELGVSYRVHDYNGSGGPSVAQMAAHPAVIWFSGPRIIGPNTADVANLASYVDGGGKLFLSSQDFLIIYNVSGVSGFPTEVMGVADYDGDGGDYTSVTGTPESIFAGLGPFALDYGNIIDFSDHLIVQPPGTLALVGNNGNGAAVVSPDTVFFAFPFPALHDDSARTTSAPLRRVMGAVLNHLIGFAGACLDSDLAVALPGDLAVCGDGSVNLNADASGGVGELTYSWSPTTGLSDPSSANPEASPETSTTYIVTVTDGNGCQASASITIKILPGGADFYPAWQNPSAFDASLDLVPDTSINMLDLVTGVTQCGAF